MTPPKPHEPDVHPHESPYAPHRGAAQQTGLRWMMSSKIHKATVTQAALDYVGSITIDENLMDLCGLLTGEKVLVVSNTNGARLETYTIPGERDSGVICLNGAAAHLIDVGHEIIIVGFQLASTTIDPKVILVDADNKFSRWL